MMIASVAKVSSLANPLLNPPWKTVDGQNLKPITLDEVKATKPKKHGDYNPFQAETRETHLERIHFMMENGFDMDYDPITVTNMKGFHPVVDGNHRLAAALLRGEEWVFAHATSVNVAALIAY